MNLAYFDGKTRLFTMAKKAVMLLSHSSKMGKTANIQLFIDFSGFASFRFGRVAGCFEVSLLASDKNNAHQHSVQEFSTFEIGIFSDS